MTIDYFFLETGLGLGLLAFMAVFFSRKSPRWFLIEKISAIVLLAIFAVRYMSYDKLAGELVSGVTTCNHVGICSTSPIMALQGFSMGPIWAFFSGAALYLYIGGLLLAVCYPFFRNLKFIRDLLKWVFTPAFLLYIVCYHPVLLLQLDPTLVSPSNAVGFYVNAMFALEAGAYLLVLLSVWADSGKERMRKRDFGVLFLALFGVILATTMRWSPEFFFGDLSTRLVPTAFSLTHRWMLYLMVLVPFVLYFLLRNKSLETKRFVLIFWLAGTCVEFVFHLNYQMFLFPWKYESNYALYLAGALADPKSGVEFLPLHACNLALFIILLCYVFKLKKVFYWSYFIMVFGALMAMLMPDLTQGSNVFYEENVNFFTNHIVVFGAPLLGVALGVFPHPKMKDMWNSFIWFGLYYLVITIHNAYYGTDFLFTNSDFVADKLGSWADDLFNQSISFSIGAHAVTFHPLYQIAYCFVYLLLAFAMWYVYELFFLISDRHKALAERCREIKDGHLAFKSIMRGRKEDKPMEENAGISLEIRHFYKRYGANKEWAVEDANLVVNGGEIFGMLGPNGAGKSTTIKSVVGIQSLSKGQILVCGYDIEQQPSQAKALIGFVPDHYALYEKLTAREYINYIADLYRISKADRLERIDKYIALFHLTEAFDNELSTYSHGMKQKITIVAALIHNPKVWILDEPLTGLDPDSIYQVKECMRMHAAEGNIVIFSSHLIDVVENICSRIVIIKKGHMFAPIGMDEVHEQGGLENYYMAATDDDYKKHPEVGDLADKISSPDKKGKEKA